MKTIITLTALIGAVLLNQAGAELIPTPETTQALLYWSAGLAGATMYLALEGYARKVGGLTFLRLGRFQLSFCITSK